MTEVPPRLAWTRIAVVGAAAIVMTAAAFFVTVQFGERLVAPDAARPAVARGESGSALLHVLVTLAAVIAVGRALGWLLRFVGQPPVMGEVVAGILLGPSLLGRLAPDLAAQLVPPGNSAASVTLGSIAQIGVILFTFLIGLELDVSILKAKARETLTISYGSIAAPFLLGATLSLGLYARGAIPGVPFLPFAMFVGASMSVTAFPLLARILKDRGLNGTPMGVVALACAAANDAAAWCLLAILTGVAQDRPEAAARVIGLTLVFTASMFLIVRPIAVRLAPRFDAQRSSQTVIAWVFVAILLSALATEVIGIHAIFGGFLLGAVIPHDTALARELRRQLEGVVSVLLLPAFFAYTGLRTEMGLVSGWQDWLWCGAIVATATAGKFGGTLAAARWSGMPWRDAAVLGSLMNARGLVELIILNIGLDLGLISPALFAMMVVMALATTFTTTPAVQFFSRGSWRTPAPAGVA